MHARDFFSDGNSCDITPTVHFIVRHSVVALIDFSIASSILRHQLGECKNNMKHEKNITRVTCSLFNDRRLIDNWFSGIILVVSIKPGVGSSASEIKKPTQNVSTVDTLMDLVRNMFPPNLVQACISQHRTEPTPPENKSSECLTSTRHYHP